MASVLNSPLDRLLEPVAKCLSRDVAKRLADLEPDPQAQVRIDQLAAKSSEGTLSDEERTEYLGYVDAIDVISILQAKARKVLASQGD